MMHKIVESDKDYMYINYAVDVDFFFANVTLSYI